LRNRREEDGAGESEQQADRHQEIV
jgi:hypothetical protein